MSRTVGNVKWYDSKKGFGFITVVTPENESTGTDIFVHYSNVNVADGYKRLFPGEYVEFEIGSGRDDRPVCLNVSGLYGGNLLCQNEDHRYKIYPKRTDEESADTNAAESGDVIAEETA